MARMRIRPCFEQRQFLLEGVHVRSEINVWNVHHFQTRHIHEALRIIGRSWCEVILLLQVQSFGMGIKATLWIVHDVDLESAQTAVQLLLDRQMRIFDALHLFARLLSK
jgi:hypothetical protein